MKNALETIIQPETHAPIPRLSVHKTTRQVNFVCRAPEANEVYLVGDFNDWDPHAHAMKRQVDGSWAIQLQLPHGYQHYRFLVDGENALDPQSYGTARDDFGEKVSLLAAS